MPMCRSIRVGAGSAFSCRASLFGNFIFQNSAKPGLDKLSFEILTSDDTEEERWASPPLVLHSAAPRPNCAWATPRHAYAQAIEAVSLVRITRDPLHWETELTCQLVIS